MSDYVALHVHGQGSIVDGLARAEQMVAAAVADGQPALAITDHGTLIDHWALARAASKAGIKPILGIEAYLAIGSRRDQNAMTIPVEDDFDGGGRSEATATKRYKHLTLLAATAPGWRNLVAGHNASQRSFWYKPRWDYELLAEHAAGLIIGTGCLGGPVAGPLLRGDHQGAADALAKLVDIAGRERLFVEVMDHGIPAERAVIPHLVALAARFGLRVVATNDSHYVLPGQAAAHDAWLAIGESTNKKTVLVGDPKRFRFAGDGYHMRTAAEMHAIFDGQPGTERAVANTLAVAEMVEANVIPATGHRLPRFPLPPGSPPAGQVLYEKVKAGAIARYGDPLPGWAKRDLRHELDVIGKAGFDDYLLIVEDLIAEARRRGIRSGPGRGCLTGDARIWTADGYRPIRDVAVGDQVRTHTGAIRTVTAVHRFDIDEPLVTIRAFGDGDGVTMTTDHKVLVNRGAPAGPEWVPAGQVDVGDLLCIPRPRREPWVDSRGYPLDDDDHLAALGGFAATGRAEHSRTLRVLTEVAPGRALPEWAAALGCRQLRAVLSGVFAAGRRDADLLSVTCVSERLMTQVRDGLWRLGAPAGVSRAGDGWRVETTAGMVAAPAFFGGADHDYVYARVYRVDTQQRQCTVHDLTVPVDHSFTTDSYVVHNSAAGSQTLYSLGVTNVAPKQNGLLFSRFLDPDRPDLPDVDMDFDSTRRDELYGYLADRYGAERVARIGSVGMTWARKSIRSIGRVTGRGDLADRVARTVPDWVGKNQPLSVCLDPDNPAGAQLRALIEADPQAAAIVADAQTIEGVASNLGLHPCGVIIGDEPLGTLIPLRRNPKDPDGPLVTEWDMDALAEFGLVKVDVLALKDLAVQDVAVTLIGNSTGEKVDPQAATDDPSDPRAAAAYATIADGNTAGIFQLASSGMTELARAVRPNQLGDLTALVSLYRPGPMGAGMHHEYADRKRGKPVDYGIFTDDPAEQAVIRGVLDSSLGVLCIAEGERVYSGTRGRYVPIEQIRVGELVQSVDDDGIYRLSPVSAILDNGTKEVVKVAFAGGRSIRVTADHLLLTAAGWQEAGMLGPQDSVAAPRGLLTDRSGGGHAPGPGTQWRRVKSVTGDGVSRVYDLTVPGDHNFVAEGVVVHNCYQESLQQLAVAVADFTPSQSNTLRKAFSKKKADLMRSMYSAWVDGGMRASRRDGATKVAFRKETLDRLWTTFESSAAYIFNKSHAAAYGRLAFEAAWLKANWPAQFGAALLAVTDADNKRQATMTALRAEGIQVAAPDVNVSGTATGVDGDGAVRLGLAEVKAVGSVAEWIVAERDRGGPYRSLADLMSRVRVPAGDGRLSRLSATTLVALIEAGACDGFGPRMGQVMIARVYPPVADLPVPDAEWGVVERAARQRDRLGVVTGDLPTTMLAGQLAAWTAPDGTSPCRTIDVPSTPGATVHLVGMVRSVETRSYSRGTLAKVVIEDADGCVETVFWNERWLALTRQGTAPVPGEVVGVSGITTEPWTPADSEDGDEEAPPQMRGTGVWRGPLHDPVRRPGPAADVPVPFGPVEAVEQVEPDDDGCDTPLAVVVPLIRPAPVHPAGPPAPVAPALEQVHQPAAVFGDTVILGVAPDVSLRGQFGSAWRALSRVYLGLQPIDDAWMGLPADWQCPPLAPANAPGPMLVLKHADGFDQATADLLIRTA